MATVNELNKDNFIESPDSPFHRGEQLVQHNMGVQEKMEKRGRRTIRDYLPDQHRDFYSQLPFILIGHVDESGWPWASLLCNTKEPGKSFMVSPNDKQLDMTATPFKGDPLNDSLSPNKRVGLLGIDVQTRRRNRLSATVQAGSANNTRLQVDQSFGNCPQYIQSRQLKVCEQRNPIAVEQFISLNHSATDLIAKADTFFVSSFAANTQSKETKNAHETVWGADVSHRGGRPGFVLVEGNKLTVPDFPGNNHFNTLGNFVENPKAGLLFVDFDQGHLLMLTGTVEIHWHTPLQSGFSNTERFWSFTVDHGIWLKNVLPFQFQFESYSPNSLLSGNWVQATESR